MGYIDLTTYPAIQNSKGGENECKNRIQRFPLILRLYIHRLPETKEKWGETREYINSET